MRNGTILDNRTKLLMKLLTTSSADIIQECRVMFGVKSVSNCLSGVNRSQEHSWRRNMVLFLVYSRIPARQWTDICNTRCSILSRFSHFHVSHFQRPPDDVYLMSVKARDTWANTTGRRHCAEWWINGEALYVADAPRCLHAHESESARGIQFWLVCRNWKILRGRRQSRTL